MLYIVGRDSEDKRISAVFMRNRNRRTLSDEFDITSEQYEFDFGGESLSACIYSDTPLYIFRHDAMEIIESNKSPVDEFGWVVAMANFNKTGAWEKVYIFYSPEIDALDYDKSQFIKLNLSIPGMSAPKPILSVPVISKKKVSGRSIFRQIGLPSSLIAQYKIVRELGDLPMSGCRPEEIATS